MEIQQVPQPIHVRDNDIAEMKLPQQAQFGRVVKVVKRRQIAVVASIVVFSAAAQNVDFRKPDIIPVPMELSYEASVPVRIDTSTIFAVSCPDASAGDWVMGKVKAWFGVANVAVETSDLASPEELGDEGYTLEASPGRIGIGANKLSGVKYAMYTLRQAAERETGGMALKGYWLPALKVKDAPALKFRGVHFCWFPECSAKFIEHQIRIAAYCKFNYAVIENWGVFKSERYPFMSVPDAPLTAAETRRLTAIADDLGITLIPQLNIFGHAALMRWRSGKHVALDRHPECQPLFEPFDGWNWCLSNPDARKVVQGLVEELHEAFGRPPFFHIGCDEADPPTCPVCRAAQPYATLVESHIKEVADLLRRRGARALMWHDMLLEKDKWKPFCARGGVEDVKMVDSLPRDIVICDYYYEEAKNEYPTLDYFASKGYSVLTCPWRNEDGIVAQTAYARSKRMFGVLETVWQQFRGREFAMMIEAASCGAWGAGKPQNRFGRGPFATLWRQCGWDMGLSDYSDMGLYDRQVTRDALAD